MKNISQKKWNEILGPNYPYMSYEYLSASESLNPESYKFLNTETVAYFTIQKTELDLFIPKKNIISRIISKIRNHFPNFLIVRILECGPPSTCGLGVIGPLKHDFFDYIKHLIKKTKCKFIVLRDFEKNHPAAAELLWRHGYKYIPNLPTAILHVRWHSFDGYLAALRSGYRTQIEKDIRKLQKAGIKIITTKDFADVATEMSNLWNETNSRAKEYNREKLDSDYFKNLSGFATAILFKDQDNLVGFSLCLSTRQTLYPIWMGVDYTYHGKVPLVFNIYYEAIRLAINERKITLDLGETTYELKLRLGAEIVPLNMFYRSTIPFLTSIITIIAHLTTPKHKLPSKKVFK